jgi:hypothetical protein
MNQEQVATHIRRLLRGSAPNGISPDAFSDCADQVHGTHTMTGGPLTSRTGVGSDENDEQLMDWIALGTPGRVSGHGTLLKS